MSNSKLLLSSIKPTTNPKSIKSSKKSLIKMSKNKNTESETTSNSPIKRHKHSESETTSNSPIKRHKHSESETTSNSPIKRQKHSESETTEIKTNNNTTTIVVKSQCTQSENPFQVEDKNRYVLFPIKYQEIFNKYKTHLAAFWTPEELDFSKDYTVFQKLNPNERHFIKMVLAFFAASDGIVCENLALRFFNEVQIQEARCFYGFQVAMENIHSETYSLLIDTLIKDKSERQQLFDAVNTFPCIKKKADWAIKYINSEESFAKRLVAFAIVEGIFFSGAFCSIFYLKSRKIMMDGLTFSNELISRDEGLHCDFAVLLYSMLPTKLPESEIHEMFQEAVEYEVEFINEALKVRLIGINSDLMKEYIQYVSDRLLKSLGYQPLFNSKNPFDWMGMISLPGKTNFFEKRVGDYQKAGVSTGKHDNNLTAYSYFDDNLDDF